MSASAAALQVPSHVPSELVVDVDMYNVPGSDTDPQNCWRVFQGKGPLVFSPYNGGHWIATEGQDVFQFFRDTTHFSSAEVGIPAPPGDKMLPIQLDPPVHGKYRANIQRFFTPSAIEALDPGIRELTIELIEGFRAKGECEFVSEFALQLPLIIFLKLVDLPLSDRLMLREHVEVFAGSTDLDEMIAAHAAMHDYLGDWVDKRIAEPGDDAITYVTRSTVDGQPYTREEMISTLTLLLHAGLDTVAMMMSFMAWHLARNPQDRAYIRENGDKMHNIVQELVRRYAGPNLARILARDYEYKGVTMKKGDKILLVPSFFNQDETINPDPDAVDFERQARHITFGSGPHTCAGALLARRELAVFLEELLTRIPDFTLDPARPPKMKTHQQNSITELWLKWNV